MNFPKEIVIRVLKSYLHDGMSHRAIQKEVLNLPAPARGGGFVAMEILHSFNIRGKHKSLLSNSLQDIGALSELQQSAVRLVIESIEIEHLAEKAIKADNLEIFANLRTTEINTQTKQRLGQRVLRRIVLENYSNKCALCEITQDDLLICSHIKPWSIDEENRLNPSNAIALCALHDKLFENGYFGLDSSCKVILSQRADDNIKGLLNGVSFRVPFRGKPDQRMLKWHREQIVEI